MTLAERPFPEARQLCGVRNCPRPLIRNHNELLCLVHGTYELPLPPLTPPPDLKRHRLPDRAGIPRKSLPPAALPSEVPLSPQRTWACAFEGWTCSALDTEAVYAHMSHHAGRRLRAP